MRHSTIYLGKHSYLKINDPDYKYPIWVHWSFVNRISMEYNPGEMFIKLKNGAIYRHVF